MVSHPASQSTTVHLPSLPHVVDVNTSDPRVRQGALYGAGAVALAGAAAYGLYSLYRYYSVRSAQYKLSYFNGRALAETSRYLFALAGVEYEDFRYPPSVNGVQSPAFEAVKDSLPYGQLPTLQVGGPNGVVLAQSKAIERSALTRPSALLPPSHPQSQQRMTSTLLLTHSCCPPFPAAVLALPCQVPGV